MNAENPTTPEVPRSVAGMEWPARCLDCGLLTEDPDAYGGDDGELMPDGTLCCRTGTFHRWAPTTRTPTTPEVALGSAINRVVNGRCENSETGRHSAVCGHPAFITDIGMPAAILAALDGWTLVRTDELGEDRMMMDLMETAIRKDEAEIARLRDALWALANFTVDKDAESIRRFARAALVPEAER